MNALREYGRWVFAEFTDVYEIEKEFNTLIDRFSVSATGTQPRDAKTSNFKDLLASCPIDGFDVDQLRTRELPREIEL